jgi:hypothetical protein
VVADNGAPQRTRPSAQSLNLYTYCGNDPVNNLDPEGLFFGKLFKWIGKILKILAIVALVVMTLIVFAPASSFLFKGALWMFFHVLLPLSQIPVLGAFVPTLLEQSQKVEMVIMLLHFIELTSRIDAPEGYANEPDFDEQLWPLLVNNAGEIDQVLLFAHPFSRLDQKSIQRYEGVGKLFADMGPMGRLSASELETLADWSFAGGHLSVLYRINRESSMLPKLLTAYPSPGKLLDTSMDTPGVEPADADELARLVEETGDAQANTEFGSSGFKSQFRDPDPTSANQARHYVGAFRASYIGGLLG